MSQGIFLQINTQQVLARLGAEGKRFRNGSSKLRMATARAVNRTLAHMRTSISKELRATYYVKQADITKAMHMKKATASKNVYGELRFAGKGSLPLISFGGKQNKNFVSVRVLRANRTRKIKSGGKRGILETSRGRAAVWIAKGQIFARTEGSDTPVILYGPSFLAFFKREGVVDRLNNQAEIMFQKRLEHEVQRIVSGAGGNNYGR